MMQIQTALQTGPAVSEEKLVKWVIEGREDAYTLFVRRYEKLVQSVVARYFSDMGAVKEVTQDTFIRAFQAVSQFRFECKLSTWLTKIAHSAALSRLRLKKQAIWAQMLDIYAAPEWGIPDSGALLEKQETYRLLREAILQLNRNDAFAIELYYLQEQSMEEIGMITGWSISNIKSRLCRARRRLREVIDEKSCPCDAFS